MQIVLFDGFDPLDVVAPYEVLYAGGTATNGAVTVELVSAEGPRDVVSGTGGLTLRAAGTLDPTRPGSCSYPAPPAGSASPARSLTPTPTARTNGNRTSSYPSCSSAP